MNFEKARFNMVEQQVRPWDVLDPEVLDQLSAIPRENFVPTQYRKLAYSDTTIPLNDHEVALLPREVGRILQAVAPESSDLVLEVGTGSGYLTALLAKMAAHVVSIEIDATLLATAKSNLTELDINNVTLKQGNGANGWTQEGPFDVIVITGALPVLADEFKQSLQVGGRMFAYVGTAPMIEARLITRVAEQQWLTTTLFETVVPQLQGVEVGQAFEF